MNNYVITSVDSRAWKTMLLPFLGSLMDVANWKGKVLVVDLGLTDEQRIMLDRMGVEHFACPVKGLDIVLERIEMLGRFVAEKDDGYYAHFDADVWFPGNIDELFEDHEKYPRDKLTCTIDKYRQPFVSGSLKNNEAKRRVEEEVSHLEKRHGNVLQVGFFAGNRRTMLEFSKLQRMIIDLQITGDGYGTDTVLLNLFDIYFPEFVNVIDQRFNCLPDWNPSIKDKKFFLKDQEMKALHVTSGHRHSLKAAKWRFEHHYPEEYKKWEKTMTTQVNFYDDVAPSMRLASIPEAQAVIATPCSENYYWLMPQFIGSLRGPGKYDGSIAVFDYCLKKEQVEELNKQD